MADRQIGAGDTVAIVGAGVGGGSAVAALRSAGFDGKIVMIGTEPELPYDRPALSKEVLTGARGPGEVALKPADWYQDHEVDARLSASVTEIAPDARVLTLDSGDSVAYTELILATGGRPRRPPFPGGDLAGIHYLRDLADVTAIRSDVGSAHKAVVVGAGFIGAEAAASLRALDLDVTMIEMLGSPMQNVLGPEVGAILARLHADEGVEVVCNEPVDRFEADDGGGVRAVVGASGRDYPADLVVVGLGIIPRVELAVGAGCDVEAGVRVDRQGRTSVAHIWAIGDVAEFPSRFGSADHSAWEPLRVEHYAHAISHATTAAQAMLGSDAPYDELPWFWSDQYDVTFNYAGHARDWDSTAWRGDPSAREFSCFYLQGGRLLAALCANQPRVFRGVRDALTAGVALGVDQLEDPDLDLRKYVKQVRARDK